MEGVSMNSYLNKSVGSDDQNSEESGWTAYFEDFLTNKREEKYSDDHQHINTTLVSDAASFVVEYNKISGKDQVFPCSSLTSLPKFAKNLNFKKPRTKEMSYDDSLEDTASSPVSSPKVMQEKGGITDHRLEPQRDEKICNEMVLEGKDKGSCTDLRKRGLCLVPMSVLVNYLG